MPYPRRLWPSGMPNRCCGSLMRPSNTSSKRLRCHQRVLSNTLTPTLAALRGQGLPYIVENVPEAEDELRPDYRLCGTQFGLRVRRHRSFEIGNWASFQLQPPCQCYRNPALLPFEHKAERAFADAMGCTWMSKFEARQAIPPAYASYLGEQLLAEREAGAA